MNIDLRLKSNILFFKAQTLIELQRSHFLYQRFFLSSAAYYYIVQLSLLWHLKQIGSPEQKTSGQFHIFSNVQRVITMPLALFFFQDYGISINTASKIILITLIDSSKYIYIYVLEQMMYDNRYCHAAVTNSKHHFFGENMQLFCENWCIFVVVVNSVKVLTHKPLPVRIWPTTQFTKNTKAKIEF